MRTAGFLRSLFLMGNALLVLGVASVQGLLTVTGSFALGGDSARLSLDGEDGITCGVESPESMFSRLALLLLSPCVLDEGLTPRLRHGFIRRAVFVPAHAHYGSARPDNLASSRAYTCASFVRDATVDATTRKHAHEDARARSRIDRSARARERESARTWLIFTHAHCINVHIKPAPWLNT